ncbi:MAG TPA: hypothetical protein VHB79_04890 [Polyangiaceae bacterium]|nr:hypothetical protein [Polyangiaceae bacterium]
MSRSSVWVISFAIVSLACRRAPQHVEELRAAVSAAGAATLPADPCHRGLRCSGAKSALSCIGGAAKAIECRGPDGCVESGGAARCDNTLARTGDACDEEHDFACALDRKAALECQAGVFRVVTSYTGIAGCELKGDEIECEPGKGPACDEIEDIACCLSFARRRVSAKKP